MPVRGFGSGVGAGAMGEAVESYETSPHTKRHSNSKPFLSKRTNELILESVVFIFGLLYRLLAYILTYIFSKFLHNSTTFAADTSGGSESDSPDPLSAALPSASELYKYVVRIHGQEGAIFPRFEKDKWTWWRGTLYLPKIQFLGKNTGDRWQSVLAYEDGWKHCTGIWDDVMWGYQVQQPPDASNWEESQGGNEGSDRWGEGSTRGSSRGGSRGSKALPINPKRRRKPFLSYMQMMDDLINTVADVNILFTGVSPVILSTNMGDQGAVATFFNDAADSYANSRVDNGEWVQLKTEVRRFHNDAFRRQFVKFVDDNFKPWGVVSVLTGLLLSAATAIQTYYQVHTNFHIGEWWDEVPLTSVTKKISCCQAEVRNEKAVFETRLERNPDQKTLAHS